jgi:hypothetical protein
MANGDGHNFEKVAPAPTAQSSDYDPFAGERAGAHVQLVGYMDTQGVPSCQQIFDTIHQLDINGPNLVGRMDQFIGGTLKGKGVTFDQLGQMADSPKFSQADKAAIAVMMNGFAHATNTNVDDPHMTIGQFSAFLIRSGVQDQCQVPRQ